MQCPQKEEPSNYISSVFLMYTIFTLLIAVHWIYIAIWKDTGDFSIGLLPRLRVDIVVTQESIYLNWYRYYNTATLITWQNLQVKDILLLTLSFFARNRNTFNSSNAYFVKSEYNYRIIHTCIEYLSLNI